MCILNGNHSMNGKSRWKEKRMYILHVSLPMKLESLNFKLATKSFNNLHSLKHLKIFINSLLILLAFRLLVVISYIIPSKGSISRIVVFMKKRRFWELAKFSKCFHT